jgi:hypothetical protein
VLFDELTAFDAVMLIDGIEDPKPVSNALPLI